MKDKAKDAYGILRRCLLAAADVNSLQFVNDPSWIQSWSTMLIEHAKIPLSDMEDAFMIAVGEHGGDAPLRAAHVIAAWQKLQQWRCNSAVAPDRAAFLLERSNYTSLGDRKGH